MRLPTDPLPIDLERWPTPWHYSKGTGSVDVYAANDQLLLRIPAAGWGGSMKEHEAIQVAKWIVRMPHVAKLALQLVRVMRDVK